MQHAKIHMKSSIIISPGKEKPSPVDPIPSSPEVSIFQKENSNTSAHSDVHLNSNDGIFGDHAAINPEPTPSQVPTTLSLLNNDNYKQPYEMTFHLSSAHQTSLNAQPFNHPP